MQHMGAVNNVATWKDGIRALTNNNRESANNDAFFSILGEKTQIYDFLRLLLLLSVIFC